MIDESRHTAHLVDAKFAHICCGCRIIAVFDRQASFDRLHPTQAH